MSFAETAHRPRFVTKVVDGVQRVDWGDASVLQTDDQVPKILVLGHAEGVLTHQDKVWPEGPGSKAAEGRNRTSIRIKEESVHHPARTEAHIHHYYSECVSDIYFVEGHIEQNKLRIPLVLIHHSPRQQAEKLRQKSAPSVVSLQGLSERSGWMWAGVRVFAVAPKITCFCVVIQASVGSLNKTDEQSHKRCSVL